MNKKAAQEQSQTSGHPAVFSVPSFLHGLGGGLIVLGLMGGWMALRVDDTLSRLQESLPSKTAVIERVDAPAPAAPTPVIMPESEEILGLDENLESMEEDETAAPSTLAATGNGLPPAPIEGLYETRPEGQVPMANLQTGQTPFEAYKKPATLIPGQPAIAVIFVGAGLSQKLTDEMIATLPDTVSLSVSPYATKPGVWMDKIRADGHEVWLTLPLQNDTYPDPDPGPQTILSAASLEQNQARLMQLLASGAGYAGVVSMGDHNITADNTAMEPLFQQLFGRGLAFADGRIDRPFFARTMAVENSYPYTQANIWLGDDISTQALAARLAEIERFAQGSGHAVVFATPTPATIKAVAQWSATLGERGLQLAPLSSVITQ